MTAVSKVTPALLRNAAACLENGMTPSKVAEELRVYADIMAVPLCEPELASQDVQAQGEKCETCKGKGYVYEGEAITGRGPDDVFPEKVACEDCDGLQRQPSEAANVELLKELREWALIRHYMGSEDELGALLNRAIQALSDKGSEARAFDPVFLSMLYSAADHVPPTLRGAVLRAYDYIAAMKGPAHE